MKGRRSRCRRVGLARATGGAVGVDHIEIKATHERTPGDAPIIEQIANVLAGHRDLIERRIGAHVLQWIGVADFGDVAGKVGGIAERLVGAVQQVA